MPTVHVERRTFVPPEKVMEAARDLSARRAELWPDVHVEHLTVHEVGDTWAEVTEGNPWPMGLVWERLRYDWSRPGSVKGTVIDSNLFKPGSTWEIRASADGAGSLIEVIGVRHLRGRGLLLYPFFVTGLAKGEVASHLRHFVDRLESESRRAG